MGDTPSQSLDADDQRRIWGSLVSAVGAELRPDDMIRGASGLEHRVQALAVDEVNNRLLVVSAEASARTAALMQVDIQATLSETHVLVARPVIFDLADISRRLLTPLSLTHIDPSAVSGLLASLNEMDDAARNAVVETYASPIIEPLTAILQRVALPNLTQIQDVVAQAALLPWREIFAAVKGEGGPIDVTNLMAIDSTEVERKLGICPLPLYEFSEADLELFLSGVDAQTIRERLKALGIYQYFFPPADQLVLGLADRGVHAPSALVAAAAPAPTLGHPFGDDELVDAQKSLVETLEAMKATGYVAEGEVGIEVTPQGRTVRSTLKYRPREGMLEKILKRISLSLSPKDFM